MRKLIPLMPLLALTTDPVSGQSASPAQVTSQTQPRLSASSAPSSSTSPATSSPVSLADILIASSPSRCSGSNPCGLLNTTLLACQANDPTCACNNTLTLQAQHCAQCIKSQAAIQQYNAYLTSCVSAGLASPTTTISVDLSSPSATIPSFSASGGPTQPSSPALTSQAASPPCDDTLTLGDTVAPPTIQSQSLPAGAAASPPSPPAPPSIAPPSSNPGLSINPTDGSARLSQTGANNRPAAPSASDQNLVAVPTTPAANSGDTAIPQATSGTVPATGGKGTLAISTPQDSSTGTNDTEASGLKSNSTNLLTVPQGDHNASLTSNTTSSANAATTQAQPSTAALNATVAFFSSSVPADCISQCQSWRSLSTRCSDDTCMCTTLGTSCASSCQSCVGSSSSVSGQDRSILMASYAKFTTACSQLPNSDRSSASKTLQPGFSSELESVPSATPRPISTGSSHRSLTTNTVTATAAAAEDEVVYANGADHGSVHFWSSPGRPGGGVGGLLAVLGVVMGVGLIDW